MKKHRPDKRHLDPSGFARIDPTLNIATPSTQTAAITALTAGRSVVYAIRVPGGAIKIGCTVRLANRLSALHGELLGFRFGDYGDERQIHALLKPHLAWGREFYLSTAPEVWAVVNAMRDEWNLPPLAA